MKKRPVNLDVEDTTGLLTTIISRCNEVIRTCQRAALQRGRDGHYDTAEMDRFIRVTRESHENIINSMKRVIEELHSV
jgi:hypothetical protein